MVTTGLIQAGADIDTPHIRLLALIASEELAPGPGTAVGPWQHGGP